MTESDNEPVLMKGNEAIAEAAIRAGCRFYAGYPITPQNEIGNYMAARLPAQGGVFIQAESEIAAVNMVYGASAAGARAMTSSSSPGMSLKQEGMSYAAGADIPLVAVNVTRGGPGLGSIAPAQSDYFQSTRGGGHGDYRCIVLAPKSVQECAGLTMLAFDLADKWRVPVIVQADGLIGQMMEGVRLPAPREAASLPARPWAVGAAREADTARHHITSIHLEAEKLDAITGRRFERYAHIAAAETRFEALGTEDAEIVIAAWGSAFRSALGAQIRAREAGIRLGLFRPVTLWPFPASQLALRAKGRPVLAVEMSRGQMVEDVKLTLFDGGVQSAVHFLGHSGGVIPGEEEIFDKAREIARGGAKLPRYDKNEDAGTRETEDGKWND